MEEIATVSGISPEPGVDARPISVAEIQEIQDAYAEAAKKAKFAGFDGISINGGFGFLPAQFLSSKANKRTDKYGGDVAGRARFMTETIQKIRSKTDADFPVLLKLSGDELREDGLSIEDTVAAAVELEKAGLSALFLAGGTQSMRDQHRVVPPMGTTPFGCYVPFAEAVKKAVSIPVVTGTRINDPQLAEEIIRDNKADLVAIARQSMADPQWAKKAKQGRIEDINKCIYCNRCLQSIWPTLTRHLRCTVNPSVYKEREYEITPATHPKKVLIAGGGPAGMEAARVAALRGHEVVLCEKDAELGGQLLIAAKAPHKDEINSFTMFLITQIRKLGVVTLLNTEVTPELVSNIKPDGVIIATGALPLIPDIPGIRKRNVVTAWDILAGNVAVEGSVVIAGGGLVGCEIAERLVLERKNVTIVEMLETIANDVEWSQRMYLMERFATYHLDIHTSTTVKGITGNGVQVEDKEGNVKELPADTVVLAMGAVPNNGLVSALEDIVDDLYTIGDCNKPYRILEAVHEAAYIARHI
jgi:NADPH-dependent 2,4-dienoyl-CoA reductase/sulfur reductase-like enzyme